jgi:hypothetical protein
MSSITSIYAALAAVTVTTTSGKTPTVYDLDELPESISTAILPARLLIPVGSNPGEGRMAEFYAIGTQMTVNWQVSDLMLWQASEQGRGLQEFAPELVDYCGKYLDAMRAFRCPVSDTALTSLDMIPGIYEWPVSSGNFYSGVLCQLTIQEHVYA